MRLSSGTAVHMAATPEPYTQGNQEEVLGMVLKAFLEPETIPNYLSGLVSPLTHPKFSHMLRSSLSSPPLPTPSTALCLEHIVKIFLLTLYHGALQASKVYKKVSIDVISFSIIILLYNYFNTYLTVCY